MVEDIGEDEAAAGVGQDIQSGVRRGEELLAHLVAGYADHETAEANDREHEHTREGHPGGDAVTRHGNRKCRRLADSASLIIGSDWRCRDPP